MRKQKIKNSKNDYAAKLRFIFSIIELSKTVNPYYFYELDWKDFLN